MLYCEINNVYRITIRYKVQKITSYILVKRINRQFTFYVVNFFFKTIKHMLNNYIFLYNLA